MGIKIINKLRAKSNRMYLESFTPTTNNMSLHQTLSALFATPAASANMAMTRHQK